ncbi:formylglycine-generating enzyme family protein [Paracoccaceae bacterium]|nr:formylglycine-generating enzyme family protein [Paracoccaceae bacterium]
MTRSTTEGGLVELPGGDFLMGSDRHYLEERPQHPTRVKPFQMDRTAVTNAQFAEFVEATDYRTTAEIPLDPATAPSMPAAYFEAGSLVFHMTDGPVDLRDFRRWWKFIPGACWRHPEGPKSTIEDRLDHPVVQVSLPDALAYAEWAGRSLPSERQWEFAARSTSDEEYSWGAALNEGDEIHANTWIGSFPFQNDRTETAPFTQSVSAYDPNAYGLYNMIGNVWEWTIDAFQNAHDPGVNCCTPSRTIEPGKNYVTKGGSFLCAPSYCRRYRASARSPQEAHSSTNNLGFRCVGRAHLD